MSYLVLARKYRPKQFAEVVGQAHVAQTLQNALAAGKVAHAYLFAGPRGVGKTTTARILAKALNCAQGPTPTPCDSCDQCVEITRGVEVIDVFEIDAASNRGIDEIRELRDTVKYAPARGRYKVYIIDEAHQITHDAFNALLKTLEEPPAHVVFVLATTEGHRIPATILSRCQRFRFRPVPREELVQQLQGIARAEHFQVEDAALEQIANAATGSLRDAVSLLDQAVSFAPGGVRSQDLDHLLGVLPAERLDEFARDLAQRDPPAVLQTIEKVVGEGWDLTQFVRDAREYFRRQLVITITPSATSPWKLPELLRILRVLSQCQEEMRWQEAQRAVLELYALRLTQPFVEVGDVIQRLEQLEAWLNRQAPASAPLPAEAPPSAATLLGSATSRPPAQVPPPQGTTARDREVGIDPSDATAGPPETSVSPASPESRTSLVTPPVGENAAAPVNIDWLGWVRQRWDKIHHELWKRPGVASVFDTSKLQAATETTLTILLRDAFQVEQAKRNLAFIEDTVARVTGRRFRVLCQQGEVTAPQDQETFVVVPEEEHSFHDAIVKSDEGVRKVLQYFPGTIRQKSSSSPSPS